MVTAQDKALAALCVERGLLDDEAIERARLAHANALESGGAPPLGQLLVLGGFLNPRLASDLLRELALSSYRCNKCTRAWTYEALSKLGRYRCDGCGERLERVMARTPTGRFTAAAPRQPEATEVLPRSVTRGSSVSRMPALDPERLQIQIAPSGPTQTAAMTDEGLLQPGRRIGPYEVVSELGRGAMGIVYLARRPGLERRFAIKVLLGGLLADNEAVERFRREAALASRIQHPSIVSVCDVGVVGGLHYYAMDYCAGKTLKGVLADKKRYPLREAVELVAKIARGVAAAHALGIVHRDVKPANIIIDANTNEPRIMDFGLARDASSSEIGMTRTGDIVGTPSYSSPEQLTGKKDVDARVDVYALGVVLYELIAGARPFHADTVAHLAAIVLTEDPRPLGTHVADVPAEIEAVIAKAMAKQPAGRYRTAADLADDLERYLRGERVHARAEGRLARVWRRRKVALAAGALALVLTVAGSVGAAFLVRGSRERNARGAREAIAKLERASHDAPDVDAFVTQGIAEIGSNVPPELVPAIDLLWARTYQRRGRHTRARSFAAKHASDPGSHGLEARKILADGLLAERKTDEAKKLLDALSEADDPEIADWALLRRALLDGSAPPAVAAARQRAAVSNDPGLLRLVAALELRDGHDKQAEGILQRIVDDVIVRDDAFANLEYAAILRRPSSPADFAGQGDMKARKHVDDFERYAGPDGKASGLLHLMRAESFLGDHDIAQMLLELDEALARGMDGVEVHALRSWSFDEQGVASAKRAAELDAERAKRLSPDPADTAKIARIVSPAASARMQTIVAKADARAKAALERALLASSEGRPTDAVLKVFDEAARLAPTCPVVALEKARACVSRFQVGAARAAFEAARAAGADERDVLLLEVVLAVRSQSLELAAELAEKLGPPGEDVRAAIAASLVAEGDGRPDAPELARVAVTRAPGDPLAHLALAEASLVADPERSIAEARAALALEARLDEEAEICYLRANVLAVLARVRAQGQFQYQRFLHQVFEERGGGGERRGDHHGFGDDVRILLTQVTRIEQLEVELPTLRIFYVHGLLLLSAGVASEGLFMKSLGEDDCPLGRAGLGLNCALTNDRAGARKAWRSARSSDPRWRLPANWINNIEDRKLVEEFAKAPR